MFLTICNWFFNQGVAVVVVLTSDEVVTHPIPATIFAMQHLTIIPSVANHFRSNPNRRLKFPP